MIVELAWKNKIRLTGKTPYLERSQFLGGTVSSMAMMMNLLALGSVYTVVWVVSYSSFLLSETS